LSALTSADIRVHSCGVCESSSQCIGVWHVSCNDLSSYDRSIGFDGVSCLSLDDGDVCECAQYRDAVHSQSVFVNESMTVDLQQCVSGANVQLVTSVAPINTDDSHKHDTSQQKGKKNPLLWILVLAILVIVVLCAVGNIVYCWRRKVNEKIASEILQQEVHADEGGVEEIALEPMEQNIGLNFSRNQKKKKNEKYVELNEENQGAGDGAATGAVTGGVSAFAFSGQ